MIVAVRRIEFRVLTGLIALALLAAPTQTESAAGAIATAAATKTVQVKGFAFKPATVKVERGSQVAFANSSNVAHTATGAGFDTRRIAPGKSVSVRFKKAGTFAYHCKIHSFMKGKVVVE
ncbi:MAG TPA: cupredoxin domain-containing protein [Solirubrobacterales bacterium]|nr:cupredoxin domain-containing protein [Solirubrobacterales bacterium]